MRSAGRVAAFLLLLGLSYAATVDLSRPTLMQLRGKWNKRSTAPKAAAAVSTASDHGEYESPAYDHKLEEKEVCLVEVLRKACSTGGSVGDEQRLWTSDVACCNGDAYERRDEGRYGPGLARLGSPGNSIGSCDWSAFFTAGDLVSPGISRVGKASALCYFSGADAHACGGPMCDRLVISLEGSVYSVTTAYSHYPKANANDADCNADTFWQNGRMAGMGAWIEGNEQYAQYQYAAQYEQQQQQLEQQMYQQHYQQQQYDPTVNANLEHYGRNEYRDDHRDGYGDDYRNQRAVYSGGATIINGIVTAFAGQRKEKWDEGIFEYVPSFTASATPYTGALNPSYPWVQDNTYKFTFYKHGAY